MTYENIKAISILKKDGNIFKEIKRYIYPSEFSVQGEISVREGEAIVVSHYVNGEHRFSVIYKGEFTPYFQFGENLSKWENGKLSRIK